MYALLCPVIASDIENIDLQHGLHIPIQMKGWRNGNIWWKQPKDKCVHDICEIWFGFDPVAKTSCKHVIHHIFIINMWMEYFMSQRRAEIKYKICITSWIWMKIDVLQWVDMHETLKRKRKSSTTNSIMYLSSMSHQTEQKLKKTNKNQVCHPVHVSNAKFERRWQNWNGCYANNTKLKWDLLLFLEIKVLKAKYELIYAIIR